jgi:hypothetical protein
MIVDEQLNENLGVTLVAPLYPAARMRCIVIRDTRFCPISRWDNAVIGQKSIAGESPRNAGEGRRLNMDRAESAGDRLYPPLPEKRLCEGIDDRLDQRRAFFETASARLPQNEERCSCY